MRQAALVSFQDDFWVGSRREWHCVPTAAWIIGRGVFEGWEEVLYYLTAALTALWLI